MTLPSLAGLRILVAGGSGEVGEGVVRQLLAAGAKVIVPVRSAQKEEEVLDRHRGECLEVVQANFSTVSEAAALREWVTGRGNLDGVLASIGGWWAGRSLVDVEHADWHSVMTSNLEPHFALARAFIPVLQRRAGSTYIPIVGGAADHAIAGSSLISITAAAVKMLGRMLREESEGGPPSVTVLQIDSFVRTRSRPDVPPGSVSADDVGELAARLFAEKQSNPIVHLRAKEFA